MNKFALIFLVLSICSYADQPPDWNEFIVQSENKKWSAAILRQGKAEEPWKDDWVLNVYEGFYVSSPAPNILPVWSTSYNPSGYFGGYLSNDGSAFSYVEFWYYPNHPVVEIYRQECSIKKNGSYFRVGSKLQQTASHQLWLKEGGNVKYYTADEKLFLQLETVKGLRKVSAVCNKKT